MKKVLKTVILSTVCVLICGVLIACAPKTPAPTPEASAEATQETPAVTPAVTQENDAASPVGEWVIFSSESTDGTVTAEEFAEIGLEMSLKFQEDGTFSMSLVGDPMTGTWEQVGAAVSIKSNDIVMELMLDKDTLVLENEDGKTIFERKA